MYRALFGVIIDVFIISTLFNTDRVNGAEGKLS